MNDQIWSWIAGGIGLIGFWFSGKKYWWSWYINIINQVAWAAFALITGYYAFLVTAAFYFAVFSRNAYLWTKDHFKSEETKLEEEREKWLADFDPDRNAVAMWVPDWSVLHKNHKMLLNKEKTTTTHYAWGCYCGAEVTRPKNAFRAMMLPPEWALCEGRPTVPLGYIKKTHPNCLTPHIPHAAHGVPTRRKFSVH